MRRRQHAQPLFLRIAICATALVSAGVGQEGPSGVVKPIARADLEKAGIRLERQAGQGQEDGKIVQLRWAGHKIPLAPSVRELDCARSQDGENLVILAGGVRDSLDVYVVGKKSGEFYRFRTGGGIRLPRAFNAGHGSWPWMEGSHLILFGYEKGGKLEYRAVSRQGFVHGRRQLDLAVKGFKVSSDTEQGFVRVRFDGASDDLEFAHPLAPRLELVPTGRMRFGKVLVGSSTQRLLRLRNSGKRPLKVRPNLRTSDFKLSMPKDGVLELQPGEQGRIAVVFRPRKAGPQMEKISLVANGAIPEVTVYLRGEGTVTAAKPEQDVDGGKKPDKPPSHPDGAGKGAGKGAGQTSENRPRQPRLRVWRLHPLGGGEVLVLCQLDLRGDPIRRLVLRNTRSQVQREVRPDGHRRFHARLAAKAFDEVQVAGLGDNGKTSPWRTVGEVQPQIEVAGGDLVVRCLPNQEFLLVAVPAAAPAKKAAGKATTRPSSSKRPSNLVLGSWRGRARSTGLMRYPVRFLRRGQRKGPMAVILVTVVDGAERRSPRVTIVE